MSKIAILDSWVDPKRISPRRYKYINVCSQKNEAATEKATHGTMCATVIDHCTSDYELINIQITPNYSGKSIKTYGDVNELAEALDMCLKLDVDIVSMSAVTSLLSDTKILYDKIKKLSEKSVIVAALDNAKFVTIPASYPFVLGVQNDSLNMMKAGEIARIQDDVFNTDIVANCNFEFLTEMDCFPSNSFAVPVVTAYVNNLLNSKLAPAEVFGQIKTLPKYTGSGSLFEEAVKIKKLISEIKPKPQSIYAYMKAPNSDLCVEMMDWLCENEETQCCAIVNRADKYDIRFCTYNPALTLPEQLQRVEWFYKTDIVFICDCDGSLESAFEYDVKLYCSGEMVTITADGDEFSPSWDKAAEVFYGLLDTDEG